MRTAGNKLYLEGFGKQGWGKDAGGLNIKRGRHFRRQYKKKIYTVKQLLKRQPKREMGLAGERDRPYLEENHFLIARLNERIRYLN